MSSIVLDSFPDRHQRQHHASEGQPIRDTERLRDGGTPQLETLGDRHQHVEPSVSGRFRHCAILRDTHLVCLHLKQHSDHREQSAAALQKEKKQSLNRTVQVGLAYIVLIHFYSFQCAHFFCCTVTNSLSQCCSDKLMLEFYFLSVLS